MTARPGPCLSVVIAAHNRGPLLQNCLLTLAQQEPVEGGFEVIVVDDSSTDGTAQVVRRARVGAPVRYIRLDGNRNRARTRNAGVTAARGELLLFLDAEMLCPPRLLRSHVELHRRFGPCAVCGWHWRLERPLIGPPVGDWVSRLQAIRHSSGAFPGINTSSCIVPFITANSSCRRADALEVGLFDEHFGGYGHEDLDLGMRLYLLGRRIISGDETVAYHQWHPSAPGLDSELARNSAYYYRKHHRKRHVLQITDFLVAGGVERFVLNLCAHLHGAQHEFTVVTANPPEHYTAQFEALGVNIVQSAPERCQELLEQYPADALDVHSPVTWLPELRRQHVRVPVIAHVHGEYEIPPGPPVSRICLAAHNLIYCQRAYNPRRNGHGIYRTIYPGSDPEAFRNLGRRAAARKELGVPEDAFLVGTAVRLDKVKLSDRMFALYLEMVRLNPRVHVLLMGGQEGREDFLAQVAAAGLEKRVLLPGAVDDVSYMLEALDLCVHAVETEPFGIAVVEALCKGLPVIAPRRGGIRETVIDGVCGFLCDTGEELIRRTLECADGAHDLVALGHNAALRGRVFDQRRTAFRHKLLYDEVIDGARYAWPPIRWR